MVFHLYKTNSAPNVVDKNLVSVKKFDEVIFKEDTFRYDISHIKWEAC